MNPPVKKEKLEEDRKRGKQTELEFCKLMQKHGCFTYRFQKGYPKAAVFERNNEYIILPDVWIVLETSTSFFAEVKGKYPSKYGAYGLEKYRVESLNKISGLTGFDVLYAIYDTRDKVWYWSSLKNLTKQPYKEFWSKTYVAGEVKRLPTCYFQKAWFIEIEKDGKLNFPSS